MDMKKYIKELIRSFHSYLPVFDENSTDKVEKLAGRMANTDRYDIIVLLSYLYKIRLSIKHR